MKKFFPLLFLIISCNNTTEVKSKIEYLNSPEHLEKDYPFSEATIVNGVIYVSGQKELKDQPTQQEFYWISDL